MKQSRNQLKQWFKKFAYPTENQFWDWIDSFFHKDDKIPAGQIDGLQEVVSGIQEGINDRIEEIAKVATNNHEELNNRDLPDQHPISAITELEEALEGLKPKMMSDIQSGIAKTAPTPLKPLDTTVVGEVLQINKRLSKRTFFNVELWYTATVDGKKYWYQDTNYMPKGEYLMIPIDNANAKIVESAGVFKIEIVSITEQEIKWRILLENKPTANFSLDFLWQSENNIVARYVNTSNIASEIKRIIPCRMDLDPTNYKVGKTFSIPNQQVNDVVYRYDVDGNKVYLAAPIVDGTCYASVDNSSVAMLAIDTDTATNELVCRVVSIILDTKGLENPLQPVDILQQFNTAGKYVEPFYIGTIEDEYNRIKVSNLRYLDNPTVAVNNPTSYVYITNVTIYPRVAGTGQGGSIIYAIGTYNGKKCSFELSNSNVSQFPSTGNAGTQNGAFDTILCGAYDEVTQKSVMLYYQGVYQNSYTPTNTFWRAKSGNNFETGTTYDIGDDKDIVCLGVWNSIAHFYTASNKYFKFDFNGSGIGRMSQPLTLDFGGIIPTFNRNNPALFKVVQIGKYCYVMLTDSGQKYYLFKINLETGSTLQVYMDNYASSKYIGAFNDLFWYVSGDGLIHAIAPQTDSEIFTSTQTASITNVSRIDNTLLVTKYQNQYVTLFNMEDYSSVEIYWKESTYQFGTFDISKDYALMYLNTGMWLIPKKDLLQGILTNKTIPTSSPTQGTPGTVILDKIDEENCFIVSGGNDNYHITNLVYTIVDAIFGYSKLNGWQELRKFFVSKELFLESIKIPQAAVNIDTTNWNNMNGISLLPGAFSYYIKCRLSGLGTIYLYDNFLNFLHANPFVKCAVILDGTLIASGSYTSMDVTLYAGYWSKVITVQANELKEIGLISDGTTVRVVV